jgi:hypothetical protein
MEGMGTGRMSVRRVRLDDFLARGPAYVKAYAAGVALPRESTVRLACARLAEQRYDLFDNNCEHLAYWCKTGHHYSPQADSLRGGVKVGAVVAALMLLLGVAG